MASVSEIMSSDVQVVAPGDSLRAAAQLMQDHDVGVMGDLQVRRLPVVDGDGRLMGIVSLADLATRQPAAIDRTLREISEPGPAAES
jgi:CBS domain-containing protein